MRMSQCGVDGFYDYEGGAEYHNSFFICDHVAIVSLTATECQCMDCLTTWPKGENFVSDYPEMDRG